MTTSQQDRLETTGVVGRGTYISAALLLGTGVVGGPVGVIALIALLSSGAVLAGVSDCRAANPNMPFVNQYDPIQHNCVTNGFYNLFSSIGRVAGLHRSSAYGNRGIPIPAIDAVHDVHAAVPASPPNVARHNLSPRAAG